MNIEKVTNIGVIVAVVSGCGLGVYDRIAHHEDRHQKRAEALVGSTLQLPQSLNLGRQVTAVLFVSKYCKCCSESMPFYMQISSLRTRESGAFRVLAVTPVGRETTVEDEQYLSEHQVPVDGIGQLQNFSDLGIQGTPTLALLDSSGRVFKAWTGKLPSDTELQIIEIIRRYCSECRAPQS
jgi:hypothetical protein